MVVRGHAQPNVTGVTFAATGAACRRRYSTLGRRSDAALTGIAKADGVMIPEGLAVDERAGHPPLVRRKQAYLKGRIGNPERRLAETVVTAWSEAKLLVIVGWTF